MVDEVRWDRMTDEEWREYVLRPVLDEARRRQFTIQMDPFNLLKPQREASEGREGRLFTEDDVLAILSDVLRFVQDGPWGSAGDFVSAPGVLG